MLILLEGFQEQLSIGFSGIPGDGLISTIPDYCFSRVACFETDNFI